MIFTFGSLHLAFLLFWEACHDSVRHSRRQTRAGLEIPRNAIRSWGDSFYCSTEEVVYYWVLARGNSRTSDTFTLVPPVSRLVLSEGFNSIRFDTSLFTYTCQSHPHGSWRTKTWMKHLIPVLENLLKFIFLILQHHNNVGIIMSWNHPICRPHCLPVTDGEGPPSW